MQLVRKPHSNIPIFQHSNIPTTVQYPLALVRPYADVRIMFTPCSSLLPAPCSLLIAPCSLLTAPCSLRNPHCPRRWLDRYADQDFAGDALTRVGGRLFNTIFQKSLYGKDFETRLEAMYSRSNDGNPLSRQAREEVDVGTRNARTYFGNFCRDALNIVVRFSFPHLSPLFFVVKT